MAITTLKPYPHVRINVKDNSIANVQTVETLPVHRPLYVMRTQEGPIGVPTWCSTYAEAVATFGAETFNPVNDVYFSKAALFLNNTLTYNGAFITRYLPDGHATAAYQLFAIVKPEFNITQYKYENGQRVMKFDSTLNAWVYVEDTDATEEDKKGVSISYGYRALAAGEKAYDLKPAIMRDEYDNFIGYQVPIFVFSASGAGAYGNDIAVRLFYSDKSNESADVQYYNSIFYNIGFLRREYNSTTAKGIADIYGRYDAPFSANPDATNPDTGASLAIDYVLDKGFSDATHVLPVSFFPYETSFNDIGLIIAAFEKDERVDVVDPYDNTVISTYIARSLNGYDDAMPIGALSQEEKAAVKIYFGFEGATAVYTKAWAKEIVDNLKLGYRVNAISCINIANVAFDHAFVADSVAELEKAELTDSSHFFLKGGSDGTFVADEENGTAAEPKWASDDRAMYDFCKLNLTGVKDTIVESLHYPFTHIFDVGFSMRTKKAILDFLNVRDDFMAVLSSQVLMSDNSGRAVPVLLENCNDQANDEANVETLRSYALLQRESALYGTDCMRASIYCHTGILSAGTYVKPVPFTYWSAMQYANYGNLAYMSASEPRGLPNSYNLLFKEWNWNNYRDSAQSRVWDNGANYVQYADMTRLFYPALRTVYRAATSVLVDEWFVAAVIYAKYVCRHAWATFSGRNDSASTLQASIKTYLDNELTQLFNNKYKFSVSVYQTDDEKEIGYIQHVKLSITSPATMRVLDVDIEVNREGYNTEEI